MISKLKIIYFKPLSVLIICLFSYSNLQGQTTQKSYDIILAGFKIGDMTIDETKKGLITEYNLNSLVSFWFFGKINVDLKINSIYKNGKMISSDTKSVSNRGSFYSKIFWDGNKYNVDSHSYKFENKTPVKSQVPFSTVKFYFEEPKAGLQMISETFGLVSSITEIEPDIYQIEIDGNRNKFYYKNGELDQVLIQNPIKNYMIKRVR